MLTLLTTPDRDDLELPVIPPRMFTHAPDPEVRGNDNRSQQPSESESTRILGEFTRQYVGLAHGIVKAELQSLEASNRGILVYVSDWNGVVNVPSQFQGMKVSFTQFVPPGEVWAL